MFGFAAFFVASIGVFVGLGFSGAAAYAGARAMAVDTHKFPGMLQRIAYAWGLTAILVAIFVMILGLNWLARASWRLPWPPRTRSTFRSRAYLDFEVSDPRLSRLAGDEQTAAAWERKVATAMWMARLKRRLPSMLVWFASAGIAMSVAAGIETRHDTQLWGPLSRISEKQVSGSGFMNWLGAATLVALSGLLVSVGRGGVRAQSKRRGANVVWDVIAFWPHTTHPFAPPPYSQLCVLDFRDRIRYHLNTLTPPAPTTPSSAERSVPAPQEVPGPTAPHGGSNVVVTAHSQGSLIAIAALLWLTPSEQNRVGLVTHGSQLQVAFRGRFRAHVHLALLETVMAKYGGRWVNLYRETDHIAGPVLSWRHWDSAKSDRAHVGQQTAAVGGVLAPYTYKSTTSADGTDRKLDAVFPTGLRVCGHDWRLLDPVPHDPGADNGPVFQIRKHSAYWADPNWKYAVNRVGGLHVLDSYPPPSQAPAGDVAVALPE